MGSEDIGWKFSWQWDYARPKIRELKLDIFDETLERYTFDGIELDFSRNPPFFKPGQVFRNIETMTEFIRQAYAIVQRHTAERDTPVRLLVRVPPSLDENLELGLDVRAWIELGIVDIVAMNGFTRLVPHGDIAQAVDCSKRSGVLIYTGVGGGTHRTSPHQGFEFNVPAVLRAIALNGYRQGAAGVHLFNVPYGEWEKIPRL